MALETRDPMAILNEELSKEPERTGMAPFFFSINDGEKALVSILLNIPQYVMADKHEWYNPATNKFEVRAICASYLELDCQHCIDAQSNKKLVADKRFVYPAYVHEVWKLTDKKTNAWERVTYTDKEGNVHPVGGFRLLEMKRSSTIFRDLREDYNEDEEHHDITKRCFVIKRENVDGDKLKTTYTVTAKAFRAIPEDVPAEWRNRDSVFRLYADACPPKIFGADDPFADEPVPAATPAKPASNGKVKNAPDF